VFIGEKFIKELMQKKKEAREARQKLLKE